MAIFSSSSLLCKIYIHLVNFFLEHLLRDVTLEFESRSYQVVFNTESFVNQADFVRLLETCELGSDGELHDAVRHGLVQVGVLAKRL
jgi:hypothetical protein